MWGDFGGRRFAEPRFEDTVAAWAAGDPPPSVVRTDLDALVALDQAPSLDPCGLIFHLSRCGSTLLARLLRQVPGTVVVAEPEIVNSVLIADRAVLDEETRLRLLRLVVRALGRRRFGDERHYILKLSSWDIRKLDLFRRAFPGVPAVWVQRRPAEVLLSLAEHSPGWQYRQEEPALAAAILGLPRKGIARLAPAEFHARALASMLAAAGAARPGALPTIDYADLPAAAWTTAAPRFGLAPGAADVERMRAEAKFYSKEAAPRLFERPARYEIPAALRALAAAHLDGLYRKLSRRTAATPALPRSGAARA